MYPIPKINVTGHGAGHRNQIHVS